MPREDWRDLESERLRRLRDRDDYGQADYSSMYGYDSRSRSGYRAYDDGRREDDGRYDAPREGRYPETRRYEAARREGERRDWDTERRHACRDGPSDRVLWAVIMERLDDERRLDVSGVEVEVRDAEVTLNGTVRHKADKRRIEDIADIDGVANVQNNLRSREQGRRWGFR